MLEEAEFRVVVGDNDPEQGQTHVTHLDAEKNETIYFTAPINYAMKFAQALLFEAGYWSDGLLIRLQRKLNPEQWIDSA
ncbi:hypothetical protein C4588_03560 [Candidatus Parcubacteria bacterium]|nr:MAG: hypothetical protein C4588_03560 [Candidatus Parcubacteria bacterium]